MDPDPVVVDFEGSEGARLALRWATEDARQRGVPVRIVDSNTHYGVGAIAPVPPADMSHARLVVLPSPEFDTMPAGPALSTGWSIAAQSGCPIVVVRLPRTESSSAGAIVVAVADPELDEPALAFAGAEAELRGLPLRVVHCRSKTRVVSQPRVEQWLPRMVASCRSAHPNVPVEVETPRGSPARLLPRYSQRAQLLVIGADGGGPPAGPLLGAVSYLLLHKAECPVALVSTAVTRALAAAVTAGA